MKIKNLFFGVGLCIFTIASTAFVHPNDKATAARPTIKAKASFPKFLSHFKKVDLPFKIELGDLYQYERPKKKISKHKKGQTAPNGISIAELQAYIPEQRMSMSRMGPPRIVPIARFYPNEKTIAVIYGTYNSFRSHKNMNFKMALYDLNGKMALRDQQDEFSFHGSFSLANISAGQTETFELDADNHIWKKTYKNLFKQDEKIYGFLDNEIIGYELKTTKVFEINHKGLVQEMKEYPDSGRASLD